MSEHLSNHLFAILLPLQVNKCQNEGSFINGEEHELVLVTALMLHPRILGERVDARSEEKETSRGARRGCGRGGQEGDRAKKEKKRHRKNSGASLKKKRGGGEGKGGEGGGEKDLNERRMKRENPYLAHAHPDMSIQFFDNHHFLVSSPIID